MKIAEGATYDSYENGHNECLPETRIELLRHVADWAESPHGKYIYWLKGGAGIGKSTISRTIARQLNNKGLLAASFFFKRGEEDRNNAKRLFPTLAQQLAIAIPELEPEIQKAVEQDPYISGRVLAKQFNKLLLRPLVNLNLGRRVTLVVVIDALDECWSDMRNNDHDIKAILGFLPQVQESKSVQLRFFLTSRPELQIRLGFETVKDNLQTYDLSSIPTSLISHDIAIFLEYAFSQIRKDHKLSVEWPGKKAVDDLLARTVPLFISAATLCRFIGDINWNPNERLQDILSVKATYVSKMASTYLPILNQLLIDQDKSEAQQLVDDFKQIVGPIIMLATPLSVNALSELLGIHSTKIEKRLGQLHSVLAVPDDLDEPVRLLHLSFGNFLLDDSTKNADDNNRFWMDGKVIHKQLTDKCLAIMDGRLEKNICKLPDDSLQRSDIDTDYMKKCMPPELQYACRYWILHLIQSHDPANVADKAISFLKVHLLHWFEVMSIWGLISEAVEAIGRLQSATQVGIGEPMINLLTRYVGV